MAMVNARFRFRYGGLAPGFPWPQGLRSLLQQLFGDLRIVGHSDHPAHLVLSEWFDVADRRRDQQRNRSRRSGKEVASSGRAKTRDRHPFGLLILIAILFQYKTSTILRIERRLPFLHLRWRWSELSWSWDISE